MAIAAFEGWNDAAEAASGVVNHLGIAWESTPIAAIDPDDFYDFQVNRPVIEVVAGKTERLVWPTTRISLARAADTGLRPIHRPIGPLAFAMLLMIASLVAACGNKGPLVKPNATSPLPPATTPATPVAPASTDGS